MRAERVIDRLITNLKKHPEIKRLGTKDFRGFLKAFLDRSAADDLVAYTSDQLAGMVVSAWQHIHSRKLGRHKIRLYNPHGKHHSWECDHSVIEIINDDMPFLFDSVLGAITDRGIRTHLALHPVLKIRRDGKGGLTAIASEKAKSGSIARESLIYLHIDRLDDEQSRLELVDEISSVLDDVRTVVLDWPLIRERVSDIITEFQNAPPPIPVDELAEAIQFLDWLNDDNFTFLGIRQYQFKGGAAHGQLQAVKGSGLGVLRDPEVQVLRRGRKLVSITPEVREFLNQPAPLIITKANVRATVHRRVHMDYIGIKKFNNAGKLTGEIRLVGLFSSTAYTRSPSNIPQLRRKIAEVIGYGNLLPSSHSGKALLNVLENYPRDELFQIDVPTLAKISYGIRQLYLRPRTKIFVRRDKFDRFVSILVYVPRDRFNTAVRQNIGSLLAECFEGVVSAFYPNYPEGPLVRVHYIIGRYEGVTPSPDIDKLEAKIADLVRTWSDNLSDGVHRIYENTKATDIIDRYSSAFSAAYQEAYTVEEALGDIVHLEELVDQPGPGVEFYARKDDAPATLRLKLYNRASPIALSDRLPILENMGLKAINERSYRITRKDGDDFLVFWLHEIILTIKGEIAVALPKIKELLKQGFLAVWRDEAENDLYNSLILTQALPWREASILRACSKYLRQTGIPYSQPYMSSTMVKHGRIAKCLVQLFHKRFVLEPVSDAKRSSDQRVLIKKIEQDLIEVSSLDEDRIIRRFVNVITSMWRTNYFQTDKNKNPKPTLAFKINSQEIDDLPEPRPYTEIFVYAPDFEGVHLRGGRIARGGLRWSDRPEDFRTEVLGLAKAQQVKNAVIVPVGSKGGFVPKKLPIGGGRDEIIQEAIRCYKKFISSLLDLTDNLTGDKTKPPKQTLRHDDADPYLVVAADKGTASFSDIANGISQEHDFWLDDAFASGGSVGYDHKKMGITARGGWEAVKRHFREMEVDIQTTPFSVIGVGDMSGDVFGNGMLLSKQIKLLAAFDHRDIFIDPDPDPKKSHVERARLFVRNRSSWQDYNKKLISKGGGVFSRAEKSIKLSPEIKTLTGLKANQATPDEIIHAILKSSADLLWFGGIGTYVRASGESDAQTGDRANDGIRISAKDLCVKVIGEGANLGITQLGRIEFAQAGGRINTDAIDNSAGVNSSDMEVNIKIALGAAEVSGKLKRPERNKFLASMTDEVADLVLRNNYQQTLALSLAQSSGIQDFDFQTRFMRDLEARGKLNREVEFLPDDMSLIERENAGLALTRPELSVLLAYAKIDLFDKLLASDVPDDPYLGGELKRYFPKRLEKKYSSTISSHRLRREIISTMLSNSMINRGGPTFVSQLVDETGAEIAEIAAAYALARDSFALVDLNAAIDDLDTKIENKMQTDLYLFLQALLRRQTIWFLRNVNLQDGLEGQVHHYRTGIDALERGLNKTLPRNLTIIINKEKKRLSEAHIPQALAEKFARLRFLMRAPEIISVAKQCQTSLEITARIFYEIGSKLKIAKLANDAQQIDTSDYFDNLALNRQIDNLYAAHCGVVTNILQTGGKNTLDAWLKSNQETLQRTEAALEDLFALGDLTLAKLAVANGYIRDLLQS